jgi:predicted RNA-binding protein with PIN domain
MRYLIDGYNLLHALWPGEWRKLTARAWPRFRQRLLERLRAHHQGDPGTATIVFDTSRSPPGEPTEQDWYGVTVRFAFGYPSADDLIEELIRTDSAPDRLTVVSDDRRIKEAARRRGCVVLGCLDYLERAGRTVQPEKVREEPPIKPENIAPDEVDRWLKEFGGTAGDA